MGFFNDIFGGQAAAPTQVPAAPAQVAAPAGNIHDPATLAAQSTLASEMPPAPAQGSADTSLAPYEKLWDTIPKPEGQAAPAELTQEAVAAAVNKMNFADSISPEHLAAIAQGGEAAQQAFAQAMNGMARQVMTQATLVNNKLTERAVAAAEAKFSSSLPDMLRNQAASDHLKTSNPLFSNPAVKPIIEATQQQLLQKFPNATHAEITKMTQDYITAMGESFTPKPVVAPTAGEYDWTSFA